jgi:hypothetical protein
MSCARAASSVAMTTIVIAAGMFECDCSTRACAQSELNGLVIAVRDRSTAANLCDATVVAFDGNYQQQLVKLPAQEHTSDAGTIRTPCGYVGAAERPGAYRVEISQPGYASTEVSGLIVSKEETGCHVQPVMRSVDLTPDPSAPRDAGAD